MRTTGEQAIRAFGRYETKRNLSVQTIQARRRRLIALADWAAPKHLLDLTTGDIERWLDRHGLAPQTRYIYIGYFAAFYGWAARTRLTRHDPTTELVRPKLPRLVPRPWDADAVGDAIAGADDRMRCWLLLAWFQGCRVMEMAALRVEDIHDGQVLLHGKGRKERTVPLHPEVWRALRAYGLPRAGYVFRRRDGWPLKPASVGTYVGRYLKSLGIEASAHQGRHRFGTDMYELTGGDLLMVAELMGHSSMQTTRGYAAWSQSKAAGFVAQLALPTKPQVTPLSRWAS